MLSTVCVWVSFQHCHLTSVYDYLVFEKCKIPRRGSALCLITAVTQPSVAQKVILSARLSVILILVLFANSELSLSVWRTSRGVPHSWSMSMHVQLCIISTGYLRFRQTTNIHSFMFMFQIFTDMRHATGGGLLVLDGCRRWWGEESLPWHFSARRPTPHLPCLLCLCPQ